MRPHALVATGACIASAALLGCLDALLPHSPQGGSVSLAIAPVFESFGATGSVPGDVDLIRLVLRNPPAPDTTLNFPIGPGQDSLTINVPIVIWTALDTVGVTFQAIRSSDSTVLYQGSHDYAVQVGPPMAPTSLVAIYVGPGRNIRALTVVPPSVTIRPGDSVQFTWSGADSAGNVLPEDSIPVWFKSLDTRAVSVSVSGWARGVTEGTAQVVITSLARSTIRDTTTVTVSASAPQLASLSVAPGYAVLLAGGSLALQVGGKDVNGLSVAPTGVSYSSGAPGVATVDAGGLVTAVGAGTAVIVARAPTSTGTAADSALVVVPAAGSAVVAALGDSRAFDAAAAGAGVTALLLVDLRAVPGDSLGSYNAQLNWNPAVLRYDSSAAVDPGFAGATVVNAGSASSGQLQFGSANAAGTGGSFALFRVSFTGVAAGSSPLTLTLSDLSTAKTFLRLLPAAVILSGSVTVH